VEKFKDKNTGKIILEIDDEGREKKDEKYFKDLTEKKKQKEEEEIEDA